MHPNRYWLVFLAIVAAAVCWKSGVALYRLYGYYRLTARTEGNFSDWSVVRKSEENYVLKTHYTFQAGQRTYESEYEFSDQPFLNAWGAEQAIKRGKPARGDVWYSSSNPRISSLQKNYPLKECLSAALLWGLLCYFIWLGYYVASYGTHRPQK